MHDHLLSFQIWMFAKRFQKRGTSIVQSSFFVMLKNLLLWKILGILLLCFVILRVVFIFLPETGYINYQGTEIENSEISLSRLRLNDNASEFVIESSGVTTYEFEAANILINGKPYFEHRTDFQLVVEAPETGRYTAANTHFELADSSQTGSLSFWMHDCLGSLCNTTLGFFVVNKDRFNYSLYWSDASTNNDSPVKLYFGATQNVNALYIVDNGRIVTLDIPTADTPIVIESDFFSVNVSGEKARFVTNGTQATATLDSIASGEIISKGEVIFNYSANSQIYKLEKQKLSFINKEHSHSAALDSLSEYLQGTAVFQSSSAIGSERFTINLYGKITNAAIAGFSLLPTFTGWLSENIYLIALSLLSAIWGAVNLQVKGKRV